MARVVSAARALGDATVPSARVKSSGRKGSNGSTDEEKGNQYSWQGSLRWTALFLSRS
jgi:hypothetical protein